MTAYSNEKPRIGTWHAVFDIERIGKRLYRLSWEEVLDCFSDSQSVAARLLEHQRVREDRSIVVT